MHINDVESAECPVSRTTPWIFQMLVDFSESERFEHCSMYGPDLSEWPADVFDAFSIFRYEDNRVQNARIETDREMMKLEAR